MNAYNPNTKQCEIGGAHPLPTKTWHKDFAFKEKHCHYTANARSAFYLAKEFSKYRKIWMPSFLCECLLGKFECHFYEVDENLNIKIPKDVKSNDLFVVIEYFGIHHKVNVDCVVLYDKSQSMFNEPQGDFSIYSFTKHLGYPDGGLLVSNKQHNYDLQEPSKSWIEANKKFRSERANKSLHWYSSYLQSKKIDKPFGLFKMSDYTRNNLGNECYKRFDQNLKNFKVLVNRIPSFIKIFDSIPSGFPIRVKNRDKLQKELAQKFKIYCPIHWAIEKVPQKFSNSFDLSKQILTLPCDYRYDESDMDYIRYAIKKLSPDFL